MCMNHTHSRTEYESDINKRVVNHYSYVYLICAHQNRISIWLHATRSQAFQMILRIMRKGVWACKHQHRAQVRMHNGCNLFTISMHNAHTEVQVQGSNAPSQGLNAPCQAISYSFDPRLKWWLSLVLLIHGILECLICNTGLTIPIKQVTFRCAWETPQYSHGVTQKTSDAPSGDLSAKRTRWVFLRKRHPSARNATPKTSATSLSKHFGYISEHNLRKTHLCLHGVELPRRRTFMNQCAER